MKVYLYLLLILINFTSSHFALSKYESKAFSRNDRQAYPMKRKVAKFNKANYAPFEDPVDADNSRILKEKIAGNQNTYDKQKRSFRYGGYGRRYDRLVKRESRPQMLHDDPYGVVYDNGRPVGILEPYPQAYEFSPWSKVGYGENRVRNQRYSDNYEYYPKGMDSQFDEESNEEKADDSAQFGDDAYPMIQNDLKIDSNYNSKRSNLAKSPDAEYQNEDKTSFSKDERNFGRSDESNVEADRKTNSGITDDQVEELKSTLSRIKNPGPADSVEEIERSLRSILSDMGLVAEEDKMKSKREASTSEVKEDENMEEGANKIDLIKTDSGKAAEARTKREEVKQNEEPSLKASAFLSKSKEPTVAKVANYQKEGEAYIRNKRQEIKTDDIMKGLEKSGDLTVSGNKSPLASSEIDAEITAKTTPHPDKLNKRELQYQQNVEKIIQAKIDAIKDQVKREIAKMNAAGGSTAKVFERRKRDVPTNLLEEESSDLDPQKHPDEKQIPLVRGKRSVGELVPLKRVKRSLLDFSNLNKIDSGDYLELAGEKQLKQHYDSDYQLDPQEGKLLPEDFRTKAKNSKLQELLSLEEENLNENAQAGEHSSKIQERSISRLLNLETSQAKLDDNPFSKEKSEKQTKLVPAKSLSEQTPLAEPDAPALLKESAASAIVREKRDDSPTLEIKPQGRPLNTNQENYNPKMDEEEPKLEKISLSTSEDGVSNVYESASIAQKAAPSEKPSISNNSPIKLDQKSPDGSLGSLESTVNIDQAAAAEKESSNSELAEKSGDKQLEKRAADESMKADDKNLKEQKKNVESTSVKISISDESVRKRESEDDVPLMRRIKRENELAYRPDDMEMDEEDDEFDDDGFDDRTMLKREAGNDLARYSDFKDYQSEYEEPEEYKTNQKRSSQQNDEDNANPDLYESQPNNFLYRPDPYVRKKRHSLGQLSSLRSGAAMLHHIAAIRERNVQNGGKRRTKRTGGDESENDDEINQLDLFGGLPQTYNGDLSRFKRVKRNEHEASSTPSS